MSKSGFGCSGAPVMGHDSVTYSLGLFNSLKFVKNQNRPSFYILRANKNWNWKKIDWTISVYIVCGSLLRRNTFNLFSYHQMYAWYTCFALFMGPISVCMHVMFIQIVAHRLGSEEWGVLKPQQLSGIWSKLLVINHSSTPLPATPRYQRDHQPQVLQHRSPQRTNISGSDHTSSWGNIRFVTQSQRRGT